MIEFLKGTVAPVDWAVNAAIVALAVVLFVLFAFLVVLPRQSSLGDIAVQIEKVTEDLKLARETSEKIEELKKDRDEMKTLVDDFDQRLPNAQEISELSRTFEEFRSEIGLRVDLASLDRKKDDRKETIPYRVEAEGNFHQIVSFINQLEGYKRYFKITDLHIDEQEAGVSHAEFVLSTYRFIESSPEETAAKGKGKK